MSTEKAMDHRSRKMIYQYISDHPGSTFTTIQKAFDLTEGTLRYHLHYLDRHKMIDSRSKGNYRCYYPCDSRSTPLTIPEQNLSTLTELQRQLVTIIQQRSGVTISDLESMVRQERRVIQYNLKVLRDRLLILKVGNGRNTRYEYATGERLHKELIKFLTMKFLNGEIGEETYLTLKGELEKGGLRKK